MTITHLPTSRWQDYKNFYKQSLRESPQAFSWSIEEIDSKKDQEWQNKIKTMLFAVTDNDQVIGMAGFYCEKKKKLAHIAKLVRVYVSPEHRGKDIGKKILLAVLEDIKSKPHIRKVQLGVTATQTAAYNLYQSVGFQKIGEQKIAVKVGDKFYNKYLMEMILDR